jgi:hypothetical protein
MQLLVRRIFPLAALALVATTQIAQAGIFTALDLNRVTIWSNGDKPGRLIGRGIVPEMALPIDVSGGLVVNVTDADQLDVLITFDPGDCRAVGPNRSICSKTVGATKRQRVKIHNAGDGEIRFYFQNLDVQGPLTGPVNIQIDTADDTLLGSNGSCIGGQRLLHCR